MEIDKYITNDVTIITLDDKLNTISAPIAENFISEVLDGGVTKIIIDLSNLQYISSAGLRVFLSTAKKIDSVGGKLGICSLNEVVREIFEISGFDSILSVYKDKEEALLSF